MEASDHDYASFFDEEEQPVRKPAHSGSPPLFFHDGILERRVRDAFNGILNSLRETLRKFRADALIVRQGFFQFRVRFGQPKNGARHRRLNRPALTCSQEMTSEGFC